MPDAHLVVDPGIGAFHSALEARAGCPSEAASNERVVAAAAVHALRRGEVVPTFHPDACEALDEVDQLVDGHGLVTPDVDGLGDVAVHEAIRPLDAIVDVQEGTRLLAIAPDV